MPPHDVTAGDTTISLVVKVPGNPMRARVAVADSAQLSEVVRAVAEATGLPWAETSLVVRGRTLEPSADRPCSARDMGLKDDDLVLAIVKPKPPPAHIASRHDSSGVTAADDGDDDLRFQLPPTASTAQRAIATFMQQRLRCPDYVLVAFFSINLRTWLLTLLWFVSAPLVQYYFEMGPLYILGTCFALIFCNLGQRRAGEASAYSIFNEGFRELPGTLNADRLDQDIRAGHF